MTGLSAHLSMEANGASNSAIPLISEKRELATIEHRGERGWRSYLARLGVDAAIILCDRRGYEGGRHVYLVGIDQAKSNIQLTESLVGYAECVWRAFPTTSFHSYSLSSPPPVTDPRQLRHSSITRVKGIALSRFLALYKEAAVMHACSGSDTTSALLFRSPHAGPFDQLTERRLIDALPLFQDAAIAYARSTKNEHRAALLSAMFDQVSLATFLVNPNGRPVFTNAVAQRMLDDRRFILRSADGTIACADPAQTKLLRSAIKTVATTGLEGSDWTSMRIGEAEGDWRLAVVVAANTVVGDQHLRCAMVLIHCQHRAEAPSHMLKALGLLPSEQRFLESFLSTNSLAEAARLSGLSEETARTYLKRVRGKLGVHRQLELARLIYGLVPPIRSSEPHMAGHYSA